MAPPHRGKAEFGHFHDEISPVFAADESTSSGGSRVVRSTASEVALIPMPLVALHTAASERLQRGFAGSRPRWIVLKHGTKCFRRLLRGDQPGLIIRRTRRRILGPT